MSKSVTKKLTKKTSKLDRVISGQFLMLRFFYIIGVISKYFLLYCLIQIGIYTKPKEKVLRSFFEEAGGSFVKFGQLLALRVDVLSKESSLELLDLLDNMKTFSYGEVQAIFLQEFGEKPEKIFKDFQKIPFASASFGQVHAAKLADNTIVAVKVMRPGLEEDLGIDFFFIDVLTTIGDIVFKIAALPWKEFAQEFKKWTRSELDYRIEATNAERLYKSAQGNKHIVIPKTFHRFSSQRILVQEYIEGIPLSRALRGLRNGKLTHAMLEKMGIDIKNSPRLLIQEIFRQYFFEGVFHADPHPGNILLLKGNRIALLDFGIVGEAFKYNLKSFVLWMECGTRKDYKKGTYHFANFSTGQLKQLISSAFPILMDEEKINEFMHMVSDHFTKTATQIINTNEKNLLEMRKDYTLIFMDIMKAAQSLKVKLPEEAVMLLRTISMVGILGKEIDITFYLFTDEIKHFLEKYPIEVLVKGDLEQPLQRINREKAIEQFNNWVAYLFEKDPELYHVVNTFVTRYNK